ncbi:MAG TPA: LemA family protein [Gemmatimonadaceae bacterium]|jgi:LemA protein|nr:LemA family protein [Gemmatimonadaceae bacterium]
MTIVIVLVVAVLIAGWLAMTFNRLVAMRNRMRGAWADVDTLLKRRADLIPNLVQSVRGYMDHEEGTLTRVTEARARAASAGSGPENAAARAEAENALTAGLRQLFAVAESYPDLKANQNVLDLQHQLGETENDIASARRYYNAVVRDFNTLRETFPNVLIAAPFGFRPGEFFELADVAQREVPKVDLGRSR